MQTTDKPDPDGLKKPLGNNAGLAQELDDARTLQRVSSLLIEDSVDRLFDQILGAAIRIMRSDFGSIQIFDEERHRLNLVAHRNLHPDAVKFWRTVAMEDATVCGSALQHCERVIVPDVRSADFLRDSESQQYWRLCGIIAVQSTPLVTRDGRMIGMISTHWREAHTPEERQLLLFDVLARQAADFVERRRAEEALRRSERHAQTLLAELQHRVRNTLAVVRSIARLTAENSTSVEEMLAHFQGRLDAFSRVQAKLTRNPDATVELDSLVEDELVAHAARAGKKVRIAGPSVSLDPKSAERLSLAVHELTTNAVKHGALGDGGKVAINWKLRRKPDGASLYFSWKESGVEIAERPSREGFGMDLLLRSLPYDLNAETEVEFAPHGLSFELRMPLPPPPSAG